MRKKLHYLKLVVYALRGIPSLSKPLCQDPVALKSVDLLVDLRMQLNEVSTKYLVYFGLYLCVAALFLDSM
jgi:hypothetical protein